MTKTISLYSLIIYFLLSLAPQRANANTVAGGEIIYEWISDSTYRFYFKLYRDCGGNTEPNTMPLCFYNPCDPAQSFSTSLSKATTPTTIYVGCTAVKTQCDSAASAIPGYKQWIYSGLATLPSRCNAWHIFTHLDHRNNSSNIQNATSSPFYAEVIFNNTGSYQGNSSPYFSLPALTYLYLNQPTTYNNGAIDPDGDSLTTELITPLTNVNSCADTVPSGIPFITTTPALNTINNPFQTNATASLNSATGAFIFSPATAGRQTAAFRIREYRNGIMIGSVTREIQIQVSNNPYPLSSNYSSDIPGSKAVNGCIGQPLSFDFYVKSADTDAILRLSDNHVFATPGATVSYTRQLSDSVHCFFNWTPGVNDAGLKNLLIALKDSTCKPPGIILYYVNNLNIYIWPPLSALGDTSICVGDTAYLGVHGGGSYKWSVLPGGTPGSLSCTSCASPKATPAVTTQYEVVSFNSGTPCPLSVDTVTVDVRTNLNYPRIRIMASPGIIVNPGTTITFTATVTNCTNARYQWLLNGQELFGDTTQTFISSTLQDLDTIACKLMCRDDCPRPWDTISNMAVIQTYTGIKETGNVSNIHIYPNPNNGSFIIKGHIPANSCSIQVTNTLGQIVYSNTLPVHDSEISEQIKLDIPAGVYQLRANNAVLPFTVNGK